MNRVFDCKEAAQYLRVSLRTLHRYRTDGLIAFVQVGKKVLFTEEYLQDFLKTYKKDTFVDQKRRGVWNG